MKKRWHTYLYILILLILVLSPSPAAADPEPEVYLGDLVYETDEQFNDLNQSVVRLSVGCTGLLIAPRLVLTAEHCEGTPGLSFVRFADATTAGVIDYSVFPPKQDITLFNRWERHDADIQIWVMDHPANVALPYFNRWGVAGNDMPFYGFGTEHSNPNGPLRKGECDLTQALYDDDIRGWSIQTNCDHKVEGERGDSGGPVFDTDLRYVGLHVSSPNDGQPPGSGNVNNIVVSAESYSQWIQGIVDGYRNDLVLGDFDGDGQGDLYYWNSQGQDDWYDLSGAGGLDHAWEGVDGAWCSNGELYPGDFNNDKHQDLLCFRGWWYPYGLEIDYADSDGNFNSVDWRKYGHWCENELYVGDFNSDGYDDLYCRGYDGWRRVDYNSKTSEPFASSDWEEQNNWCQHQLYVGNFSLGGGDDLLCWDKGNAIAIAYSTRSNFNRDWFIYYYWTYEYALTDWCRGKLYVDDFNGDYLDDLFCWNESEDYMAIDYAWMFGKDYSPRSEFPFTGTDWKNDENDWCRSEMFTQNMNIDNKADLVCYDDRIGKIWVNINTSETIFDRYTDWKLPNIDQGAWP